MKNNHHDNECNCSENLLYKIGKTSEGKEICHAFIIGLENKNTNSIIEIFGLDGFKNEEYAEHAAQQLINFFEYYKVFSSGEVH